MTDVMIGGKSFDAAELATLAKAGMLQIGQKNDPASASPTAQPLQGVYGNGTQFGLFSAPGVRPERFSAMPRTRTLLSVLGAPRSSAYNNELLEIMTGQTPAGTTNATGFCGNPPEPGVLKTMQQAFLFGSFYAKTRLSMIPQVGLLKNRADVPGSVINSAIVDNPLIPDIAARIDDTQSEFRSEVFKLGVSAEISTENVLWRGTSGVDNSRFGWFREFAGLDTQIATGKVDAVTGIAAPAADSQVISFNADITGSDTNGRDFVIALTELYRTLQDTANAVGMAGTQHVIAMRKEQYYRAVEVWACNYQTVRCSGTQFNEVMRDASTISNFRNQLLAAQSLEIDGIPVPVVFSDGILLENLGNNILRSDIYVVPVSWAGRQLTYLDYFPMDNPYAVELAGYAGEGRIRTLNNGLYLMAERDTGNCIEFHFSMRARLILETPFLAGRLDDVRFQYLLGTRVADPGVTRLYVNGGSTYRL